jgi:hypothetical protein
VKPTKETQGAIVQSSQIMATTCFHYSSAKISNRKMAKVLEINTLAIFDPQQTHQADRVLVLNKDELLTMRRESKVVKRAKGGVIDSKISSTLMLLEMLLEVEEAAICRIPGILETVEEDSKEAINSTSCNNRQQISFSN